MKWNKASVVCSQACPIGNSPVDVIFYQLFCPRVEYQVQRRGRGKKSAWNHLFTNICQGSLMNFLLMLQGLFFSPLQTWLEAKKIPVRKYFHLTVQRSDKNVVRAFYFSTHINLNFAPPQSLLKSSGSHCSTLMQIPGRHSLPFCGAAMTWVVKGGITQLRELSQLLCCCCPPMVSSQSFTESNLLSG